jgi:hypothetical protein
MSQYDPDDTPDSHHVHEETQTQALMDGIMSIATSMRYVQNVTAAVSAQDPVSDE